MSKNNGLSNDELKKWQENFNKSNKLSPATSSKSLKEKTNRLGASNQNNKNKRKQNPDSRCQINLPSSSAEFFLIENDILDKNNSMKIDNLYLLHNKYSLQFKGEDLSLEKPVSFLKAVKLPALFKITDSKTGKKKEYTRPKPCKIDETATSQFKLNKRTKDLATSYSVGEPICFTFELLDKLAIGMGGESPYDDLLLMTFHPLYGLPYLPATAIKGMLLSYYEQTDKIKEEERKKLFGSKDSASQLIFFDTFPAAAEKKEDNGFQIVFDVFTPHYGDYYGGKGRVEPTDDQKTKIITFPCVKSASFDVYIACRDKELWVKYSKVLYDGLEQAFRYYGIGAKTSLGYGLGV